MELVGIPENPIPEGAVCGEFNAADGIRLRYARWPAPKPNGRGTVCLFQGRAEFIEKYFETIADLLERNFSVVTMDWRGQGGSQRLLVDPRKGHVDGFEQYELDLRAFLREVVLPDCPPPHFALGHSMGGHVLLRIGRERTLFDRMVLVAPFIDFHMTPLKRRLAIGAAAAFNYLGLGDRYIPAGGATAVNTAPFAGNELTSDPDRYQRANAIIDVAPNLALGSPTIGWIHAAARAIREIATEDFAFGIKIPTLVISAGSDTVVSNPAIEQFVAAMRIGSNLVIPGARHELMMERDVYREQFLAAVDAFVPGALEKVA